MTNRKSLAGSAPGLRQGLVLGTALATSAFVGGYVRRAYAACTAIGFGHYNCSGTETTTQTLGGSPDLVVTTDPGFSIDTGAGPAFLLTGTGGVTFTDLNGSTITGAGSGVVATNNASGALSITTTGHVQGVSAEGIRAINNGTDLTIDVADVTGGSGNNGVYAANRGSGATTITINGDISAGFAGVSASTLASATALTVSTAAGTTVVGARYGVSAVGLGSGPITVTVAGSATGNTYAGVVAAGLGAVAGDVIVDVNNATGATHGIYGYQDAAHAGTLSVTAVGVVTGDDNGIRTASSSGSGVTITVTGDVSGNTGAGIDAQNDSADGSATTEVIVDSGATVTGDTAGVNAASATGRALSITNAGTMTGNTGILANAGATTINNTGTVEGTGGTAIDLTGAAAASTVNQQGGTVVGDILLSTAADTLNITGGAIEGDVVGQGNDQVNFTLSGTFTHAASRAMTGLDDIAMNAGTVNFAGTADAQSMTINGGTMIVSGAVDTPVFRLNGGTLSVASDANMGSDAGALAFDGGTLQNTAAFSSSRAVTIGAGGGTFETGADLTWSSAIAGTGTLTKTGAGMLSLTGDSSGFAGSTMVDAGVLSVNGSLCGGLDVLAGGQLQGTGTVCEVENFSGGSIAPGNSIGTLTVAGDYVGSGGYLDIEAVLGGDASSTDMLIVTGNTSGATDVRVTHLGGGGAQTVDGIEIIDVGGTSSGTFSLVGDYVFEGDQAVVGGGYAYRLFQGGVGTPDDGDWYLRSTLIEDPSQPDQSPHYSPALPLYEAYADVLQSFDTLGTMRQRVGNRSWAAADVPADLDALMGPVGGIWTRIDTSHAHLSPQTSTTGTEYDIGTWKVQAGIDAPLFEMAGGTLVGGASVHYGSAQSDVTSRFGDGSVNATGIGASGTLTWLGDGGFYVDALAQATWFDTAISSATLDATLVEGSSGFGYGFSLEAGQEVALSPEWSLTPQMQIAYSAVRFDAFTDPYGAAVSSGRDESLTGRLGLSIDYANAWTDAAGGSNRAQLYGLANLRYDLLDGSEVAVSDVETVNDGDAVWGELGLGGELSWSDGKYAVHGQALLSTGLEHFGNDYALSGTLGFRMRW